MINSIIEKEAHIRLHIPPGIAALFRNDEIMDIIHNQQFEPTNIGNNQFTLYFVKSPSSLKTLRYHLNRLSRELFSSSIPHSLYLSEISQTSTFSAKDIDLIFHYLYWISEDIEDKWFRFNKTPLRPESVISKDLSTMKWSVNRAKELSEYLEEYFRLSDNQATYLSTVKAKQLLNN